jgi:putative ABC transport system substrate-binding protein
VATNGIDFTKLGARTAQMAVKIIKGQKVADLPVETPKDISLVVNSKFAKLFNVDPAKIVK